MISIPNTRKRKRDVALLTLAATGVVFGDIGTSPLYTLRACFSGTHAMPITPENIFGILSLIVWSLILSVALKYVVFIMQADNNGEGGALALLALTKRVSTSHKMLKRGLVVAGLMGAALFLGDGMLTPAVTVLGAVEGLKVAAPELQHFIIPISLLIIVILFTVQRLGTIRVGSWFGPVMIVWFITLAALGLHSIQLTPSVSQALNPLYAFGFLQTHGWASLAVLGAVVLVVTGGEALYADMGHFGRRPIRIAWFCLVLPSLVLNYFGQGALLLREPAAVANPFFHLAPEPLLWPLLMLSVIASMIASQAVISGVFSITRQAVQLGYWPRLLIRYTSEKEAGQIYIPGMNWLLFVAVVLLVLGFQSSSNMAAAYGISVTAAMMVDTVLATVVAHGLWHRPWIAVLGPLVIFLTIDSAFLFANLRKFVAGGWFPVVVGGLLLTLMLTWRRGRKLLNEKIGQATMPVDEFVNTLHIDRPVTVPGTAIFMTSMPGRIPFALMHNIRHNKMLHKRNILLTVHTSRIPVVIPEDRVLIEDIGEGFFIVNAFYGFQQSPDVRELLRACAMSGLDIHENDVSFFINRERLIVSAEKGLPPIFDSIFVMMHRNSMSATDYFNIPSNRVIEMGSQMEV